jgi:hypothetical protein
MLCRMRGIRINHGRSFSTLTLRSGMPRNRIVASDFLLQQLSTIDDCPCKRYRTEKIRSLSAAVQFSMQYVPLDLHILGCCFTLSSHIHKHNHYIGHSPLVRPHQRKEWEEFAWANRGTIDVSFNAVVDTPARLLILTPSSFFETRSNACFLSMGESKHEASRIRSKLLREDFL